MARRVLALWVASLAVGCGSGDETAASGPVGDPSGSRGVQTAQHAPPAEASSPLDRIAIERAIAAADLRFAPRMVDGVPALGVPGSLTARFDSDGAHLTLASGAHLTLASGAHLTLASGASVPTSTIALSAIGRGDTLREVPAARATIEGPEVRLLRDALGTVVEWWRALPSGLEHGVTIAERPTGSELLVLELTMRGELSARALSDDAVELVDEDGDVRGLYASLVVLGSDGAAVPGRMSVHDGRVRIEIDDRGAQYPLVIDPLLTSLEATLLAPDRSSFDYYGYAVALSADGSRALIGALYDATIGGYDAGSARVLVRSGAMWTEEQMLLAPDAEEIDQLGSAVSISADGTRALVGASGDTTSGGRTGSARVFVRSGSTWTEEAKLVPMGGGDQARFGAAAHLSADGTRAIVGSYWADTAAGINAGTATVFSRSGAVWTFEQTLVAASADGDEWFGYSVALTADGGRAIIGSPYEDGGRARAFVRVGTTWTEEATMRPPVAEGASVFGRSVAVSGDGMRALVGAWDDAVGGQDEAGSAWVFSRAGASWTQEASLFASGGAAGDFFGWAVSLSGDGRRALVGAYGDDTGAGISTGSARLFERVGTVWTEQSTLVAASGAADDAFGGAVALSGDGMRAIVGADHDDMLAGSAHVFEVLSSNGSTCASAGECVTGLCVDGRCCNVACGGGAADCQACSIAAGGTTDGTCTALSAVAAPAMTCRASAGTCDVAETCSSASMVCPSDTFASSATTCRVSGGDCDVAETCSGSSATCPADAFAGATTTCRVSGGDCDVAETCSGSSATCPADAFAGATTTCRVSGGDCDVAETCTGASATCPADTFAAASTMCRVSGGDCDVAETCTGSSATCPADAFAAATTTCRVSGGDCDVAETCTGSSATCPADAFVAASTTCRVSGGDCDVAETCSGSSATCPADAFVAATTTCRVSGGDCDVAETCTGSSATCPADAFAPAGHVCAPAADGECDAPDVCAGDSLTCIETFAAAGTSCGPAATDACDAPDQCAGTSADCVSEVVASGVSCRPSSEGSCDPEEQCDGIATSCPPDVSTCADDGGTPMPDAAIDPDAGMPMPDASVDLDAGDASSADAASLDAAPVEADAGPPATGDGCACRMSNAQRSPSLLLLGLVGLVLARRRRGAAPTRS